MADEAAARPARSVSNCVASSLSNRRLLDTDALADDRNRPPAGCRVGQDLPPQQQFDGTPAGADLGFTALGVQADQEFGREFRMLLRRRSPSRPPVGRHIVQVPQGPAGHATFRCFGVRRSAIVEANTSAVEDVAVGPGLAAAARSGVAVLASKVSMAVLLPTPFEPAA